MVENEKYTIGGLGNTSISQSIYTYSFRDENDAMDIDVGELNLGIFNCLFKEETMTEVAPEIF